MLCVSCSPPPPRAQNETGKGFPIEIALLRLKLASDLAGINLHVLDETSDNASTNAGSRLVATIGERRNTEAMQSAAKADKDRTATEVAMDEGYPGSTSSGGGASDDGASGCSAWPGMDAFHPWWPRSWGRTWWRMCPAMVGRSGR